MTGHHHVRGRCQARVPASVYRRDPARCPNPAKVYLRGVGRLCKNHAALHARKGAIDIWTGPDQTANPWPRGRRQPAAAPC